MAIFLGPGIPNSGLVLHLDATNPRSYPGTGTAWNDLSGNGNNGTLINGPTYSSANNGSIVFDGVNDHTIIPGFPLLAPLSICAWIYKTQHTPWTSIIDRYASETLDSVSLGFDDITGQKLMYMWNNSGTWGNRVYSNSTVGLNTWNHICISATATNVNFYINGAFDATAICGQVIQTGDFYIAVNLPGGDEYYGGRVSTVQVYNRALTAQEISQNFTATRGRYGI